SVLAVLALSAVSLLAMFSFIVVCILAIWAFICSGFALVSAGVVAAGVTVTEGVAVTGGVGAGVAVGAGFWARAGIHIRESATIDTRTGLGRFMGVLLDSALDGWGGIPTGSSESEGPEGPRLVQETLFWRHRPQHSAQCSTVRYNSGPLWLRSMVTSAQSRRRLACPMGGGTKVGAEGLDRPENPTAVRVRVKVRRNLSQR